MIMLLSALTKSDVGRWVKWTSPINGHTEKGRIKKWNDKWVFVVYHCNDDWENFEKYTAAATHPNNLSFWTRRSYDRLAK